MVVGWEIGLRKEKVVQDHDKKLNIMMGLVCLIIRHVLSWSYDTVAHAAGQVSTGRDFGSDGQARTRTQPYC